MIEIDVLQIFKEYYPSYMRGDTPLEPYYSFFGGGFSACEETLVKELEQENAKLKAQIDQLSNDNHVLKTSFITQQEQIGKMKNVGNCKHSMKCAKWNEKQCNLGLMKFCLNCKNWELAE